MKTDKINQVINKVVKEVGKSTPPQPRAKLEIEPDIIDIPKKEKPTLFQEIKAFVTPHISGLTKGKVRELESMPIEDFWVRSQEFISESYGIPPHLRAPMFVQDLEKGLYAAYGFDANIIQVSPKLTKKSRGVIYGALKHEHWHQKQNFDVLRTENLGEEAVKRYAQAKAEFGVNTFKNAYREMSEEELEKLRPQLGENYDLVVRYREAVKQGEEAEKAFLDAGREADYQAIFKELDNFRQQVIKEFGVIPAGSEEAKVSEKYLSGVFGTQNTKASLSTAFGTRHEIEANIAEAVAQVEYYLAKFGFIK